MGDEFIHSPRTIWVARCGLVTLVISVLLIFASIWTTGDFWPMRLFGTSMVWVVMSAPCWVFAGIWHDNDKYDQRALREKKRMLSIQDRAS